MRLDRPGPSSGPSNMAWTTPRGRRCDASPLALDGQPSRHTRTLSRLRHQRHPTGADAVVRVLLPRPRLGMSSVDRPPGATVPLISAPNRQTRPVPSPAFNQESRRNEVQPLQNVRTPEMDDSYVLGLIANAILLGGSNVYARLEGRRLTRLLVPGSWASAGVRSSTR